MQQNMEHTFLPEQPETMIRRFIPLVIMMGVIFYFSHQPGDSLDLPDFWMSDKVAHCSAYFLLGVSVVYGFASLRFRPALIALIAIFFCLAYGITDEFHQSFIPLRSVSSGDVLADTTGGILAAFFFLAVRRRLPALTRF